MKKIALPGGNWWGGSTHRDKTVYLHILRWPSDTISLPPIKHKIVSHSVPTGGKASVEQADARITISIPKAQRDALDTIVRLELDGPAAELVPVKSKTKK